MSGDLGLHEENSIIFYTSKMTEAKRILLEHKGIRLHYDYTKKESRNKYS